MLQHITITKKEHQNWLVFIHGLGGNNTLFHKQRDFLANHYNLLLIDLPGHGTCEGLPQKRYTPELIVQKIKELLDHLQIKEAFFITFSLGTIIGNEILNRAHQYVKAMVLAGPVLKFNLWSTVLIHSAWTLRRLAPYMAFYKIFASIMMPKKSHTKSRYFFVREAKKLGRKEFVKWTSLLMRAKEPYLNMKKAARKIPKLYLIGEEDHMFLKEVKKTVQTEECAELKILPQCGHVCLLEKGQESNEAIQHFLLKNQ